MKVIVNKAAVFAIVLCGIIGAGALVPACFGSAAGVAQDAQPAVAKRIGSVKTISGTAITLTPDSGPEIAVTVQPNARIIRLATGEKDLKNATPIQLSDLQVGDKIRVRGYASNDGKSLMALEVLQITTTAVADVRDKIRDDWQKRGLSGPVSAVDPAAGTISITSSGLAGKKTIVVHIAKNTIVRRYAPDSAKFEDAKVSTLQEIHSGDQLRARGERSADGNDFTADEVVTGYFSSIEGTIKSIDATSSTLSVQDVLSKKTLQVKISGDSQLHQIPAEMANRIAVRIKSQLPPGTPGAGGNSVATGAGGNGQPPTGQAGPTAGGAERSPGGNAPSGVPGGGMGGGARAGGGFDFQRLLDGTPAVKLADLHKGDAVVILATQGMPSGDNSTVIKLFSGVEPILQAAPSGSQAMMLAPWSLGGAPGGDASQ